MPLAWPGCCECGERAAAASERPVCIPIGVVPGEEQKSLQVPCTCPAAAASLPATAAKQLAVRADGGVCQAQRTGFAQQLQHVLCCSVSGRITWLGAREALAALGSWGLVCGLELGGAWPEEAPAEGLPLAVALVTLAAACLSLTMHLLLPSSTSREMRQQLQQRRPGGSSEEGVPAQTHQDGMTGWMRLQCRSIASLFAHVFLISGCACWMVLHAVAGRGSQVCVGLATFWALVSALAHRSCRSMPSLLIADLPLCAGQAGASDRGASTGKVFPTSARIEEVPLCDHFCGGRVEADMGYCLPNAFGAGAAGGKLLDASSAPLPPEPMPKVVPSPTEPLPPTHVVQPQPRSVEYAEGGAGPVCRCGGGAPTTAGSTPPATAVALMAAAVVTSGLQPAEASPASATGPAADPGVAGSRVRGVEEGAANPIKPAPPALVFNDPWQLKVGMTRSAGPSDMGSDSPVRLINVNPGGRLQRSGSNKLTPLPPRGASNSNAVAAAAEAVVAAVAAVSSITATAPAAPAAAPVSAPDVAAGRSSSGRRIKAVAPAPPGLPATLAAAAASATMPVVQAKEAAPTAVVHATSAQGPRDVESFTPIGSESFVGTVSDITSTTAAISAHQQAEGPSRTNNGSTSAKTLGPKRGKEEASRPNSEQDEERLESKCSSGSSRTSDNDSSAEADDSSASSSASDTEEANTCELAWPIASGSYNSEGSGSGKGKFKRGHTVHRISLAIPTMPEGQSGDVPDDCSPTQVDSPVSRPNREEGAHAEVLQSLAEEPEASKSGWAGGQQDAGLGETHSRPNSPPRDPPAPSAHADVQQPKVEEPTITAEQLKDQFFINVKRRRVQLGDPVSAARVEEIMETLEAAYGDSKSVDGNNQDWLVDTFTGGPADDDEGVHQDLSSLNGDKFSLSKFNEIREELLHAQFGAQQTMNPLASIIAATQAAASFRGSMAASDRGSYIPSRNAHTPNFATAASGGGSRRESIVGSTSGSRSVSRRGSVLNPWDQVTLNPSPAGSKRNSVAQQSRRGSLAQRDASQLAEFLSARQSLQPPTGPGGQRNSLKLATSPIVPAAPTLSATPAKTVAVKSTVQDEGGPDASDFERASTADSSQPNVAGNAGAAAGQTGTGAGCVAGGALSASGVGAGGACTPGYGSAPEGNRAFSPASDDGNVVEKKEEKRQSIGYSAAVEPLPGSGTGVGGAEGPAGGIARRASQSGSRRSVRFAGDVEVARLRAALGDAGSGMRLKDLLQDDAFRECSIHSFLQAASQIEPNNHGAKDGHGELELLFDASSRRMTVISDRDEDEAEAQAEAEAEAAEAAEAAAEDGSATGDGSESEEEEEGEEEEEVESATDEDLGEAEEEDAGQRPQWDPAVAANHFGYADPAFSIDPDMVNEVMRMLLMLNTGLQVRQCTCKPGEAHTCMSPVASILHSQIQSLQQSLAQSLVQTRLQSRRSSHEQSQKRNRRASEDLSNSPEPAGSVSSRGDSTPPPAPEKPPHRRTTKGSRGTLESNISITVSAPGSGDRRKTPNALTVSPSGFSRCAPSPVPEEGETGGGAESETAPVLGAPGAADAGAGPSSSPSSTHS